MHIGLSPLDRSSYYRLVQKFSERFGSVRQQSRYLTKFETRKRNPEETIASLGDDLRLLAQRSYHELGTDAQESVALHQFYKAITLEMKCRCIDRDCRTVESAIQIVESYEAILGEGTDKKKSISELLTAYRTQAPPTLRLTSIVIISLNPMTSPRPLIQQKLC